MQDYISAIKNNIYKKHIERILEDLAHDTLYAQDIQQMYSNTEKKLYRIRTSKIRCIFECRNGENYIVEIDTR